MSDESRPFINFALNVSGIPSCIGRFIFEIHNLVFQGFLHPIGVKFERVNLAVRRSAYKL